MLILQKNKGVKLNFLSAATRVTNTFAVNAMVISQCFIKMIYTASFNKFFLTSKTIWVTSAVLAKGNYK